MHSVSWQPCSQVGQWPSESQSSSACKTIPLKVKEGAQSDRAMDVQVPMMAQVPLWSLKRASWSLLRLCSNHRRINPWTSVSPSYPDATRYIFLKLSDCPQGSSLHLSLPAPSPFVPACTPWPPDLDSCPLILHFLSEPSQWHLPI